MHTCLNFQAAPRIRQPVGHVLFWAISRQKLICHLPLEAWFWSSVSSIISSTHIHTAKAICPHYLHGKCFAWIDDFSSPNCHCIQVHICSWLNSLCVCVYLSVCTCLCVLPKWNKNYCAFGCGFVCVDTSKPARSLKEWQKNRRGIEYLFIRMLMRERQKTQLFLFLPGYFWLLRSIKII